MDGLYFHDGAWSETQPKLLGPLDHAFWMSSVVFDGARAFGGLAPDLDRHCERLIASAEALHLAPPVSAEAVNELCVEAVRRFPKDAELYIRPAFYATEGFINPVPESTAFVLAVYRAPMPAFNGISVCLSSRRRPARDMAPTDAKASCLYPNSARALREAEQRGFDNCIILDANGNVAELATANVWIVRDGIAMTPAPNGTFLAGITRQRVQQLLGDAGVPVRECVLSFEDVLEAEEVFSTGNYGKVVPIIRVEGRDLQRGPITEQARRLYWEFAAGCSVF